MLIPPVHSVTHVRLREIPRERGKHIVTRVDIAVVGVHVLDTHVVGIATIPEGSDGQLVESIKISARTRGRGSGRRCLAPARSLCIHRSAAWRSRPGIPV